MNNPQSIRCPRCYSPNKIPSAFCGNCGLHFDSRPQIYNRPEPPPEKSWFQKHVISVAILAVLSPVILLFLGAFTIGLIQGLQGKSINEQATPPLQTDQGTFFVDNQSKPKATPTPAPTFAELKTRGEKLLRLDEDSDYETSDLQPFDEVMKPLREIPKTDKNYKDAQALNKKLIDKSSIIGAYILVLGKKPESSKWDGRVQPVVSYLQSTLNDYDSSEFIEWSPVTRIKIGKEPYWGVRLKLRAKNAFGGKILKDTYYFIRQNQVVMSKGLNAD